MKTAAETKSRPGFRFWTREWLDLTLYQRFETGVALALTIVIAIVTLVALYRLAIDVVGGLVMGVLNPLEHSVFQAVFGQMLTVLIALEFNHTLRYVVTRDESIIQTRIVILIALLALARKFIVLDMSDLPPETLIGLAAATLALGIVYRLVAIPPRHNEETQISGPA